MNAEPNRARGLIVLWAALVFAVAGAGQAVAAPVIDWHVENPFRLFEDPADTQIFKVARAGLSEQELQTPVLSSERVVQGQSPAVGWAAAIYAKTCWDDAHNRYACHDGSDYVNPAGHMVVVELKDVEDAGLVDCTWATAPLKRSVHRGVSVTQRCDKPVRLLIPYPNGATLTVEIGGREIARTVIRVEDLLIVGLGDSFGSGEGNPDVPVRFSRERAADYGSASKTESLVGYPARDGDWAQIGDADFIKHNARWLNQACHRSLYSQQLRAALELSIEDPHRAVTFLGFACSGAEVTQGLFHTYKRNEWVPTPPDLSQISAAAVAQCGRHRTRDEDYPEAFHMGERIPELKGGLVLNRCQPQDARKIDLVFLSVGGNDIGFARIVANAVLADQSLLKKLGGWFGQVYEPSQASHLLDSLTFRYKALNRAFHTVLNVPWEESDRVILTAYPGLAILDDGRSVCPDGRAGMDVLDDFHLSTKKARDGSVIAEHLNQQMRESAKEQGWTYAQGHRRAFLGRGICAGYSDNALSSVDDLRLPRKTEAGWQPYNPADYLPYAPRQRWFRTPNDAFMTDNFHVSASVITKALKLEPLSWFQVLLASTYSGAFHPTAEGHAAIADAVVVEARGVLAKYHSRRQAQDGE